MRSDRLVLTLVLTLAFASPSAAQQLEVVPLEVPTMSISIIGGSLVEGPLPLTLSFVGVEGSVTVNASLVAGGEIEVEISVSSWLVDTLIIDFTIEDFRFDVPFVGEAQTPVLFELLPISSDRSVMTGSVEYRYNESRYLSTLLDRTMLARNPETDTRVETAPSPSFAHVERYLPGDTVDFTPVPGQPFASQRFRYTFVGDEAFTEVHRFRASAIHPPTTSMASTLGPWGPPLLIGLLIGLGIKVTRRRLG